MLVLVTYDVETVTEAGKRRLRKVSKQCINFGQRVQNSVFECSLDYSQFLILKDKLVKLIDKEKDSLRFYLLGNNWDRKVEHFGKRPELSVEDLLIV